MFLDNFPGWKDYSFMNGGVAGNIKVPTEIKEWSMATWDPSTLNGFIKSKMNNNIQRPVKNCLSVSGEIRAQVDCDVYCNARGGASMEGIARRTITDLLRFSKQYDRVLAFVGVTSPIRRSIPVNRDLDYTLGNDHVCFIPHLNKSGGPDRAVQDYYVEFSTDYHDIINFFLNATNIKNFCTQLGIELHWLNPQTDLEWYENVIKTRYKDHTWITRRYPENANDYDKELIQAKYLSLSENTDYDVLRDALDFTELVNLRALAKQVEKNVYAPNAHYSPEYHRVLASKLMPIITGGGYANQVSENYDFRDSMIDDYLSEINKLREKFYEQNHT